MVIRPGIVVLQRCPPGRNQSRKKTAEVVNVGDQYYDGHLINYSSSTGYPTIWNGSENVLLHRYVWEKYNGPIPEGYQVHHLDKNRLNFDISNLCIIPASDHARHHAIENGL